MSPAKAITSGKTRVVNFRSAEAGDETAIAEVHVLAWQNAYRGIIPDTYLDGLSVPKRTAVWQQIISELDPAARGAEHNSPQAMGVATTWKPLPPDSRNATTP